MKRIFLSILILFSGHILMAQQELSLPMMQDIPNSIRFNPAFKTGYKWNIALPSASSGLMSNGLSFNELFENAGDGKYIIQIDDAVNNLSGNTLLTNNTKVDIVGLTYQGKKTGFHAFYGLRINAGIDFPKGLAELAAFGNGPYVGETLTVGPAFEVQAFDEIGLGLSHQFGRLRVGGTLKFLSGIASAKSTKNTATLHTDEEYYQLTATTDYEIRSSSIIKLNTDNTFDIDLLEVRPGFGGGNGGFAFDLGVVFKLSDNFSLNASIVDVGSINWTENANILTSNGTYTYEGIEINSLNSLDSSSLSGVFDSIQTVMNFSQEEGASFTSKLPQKITFGGTWAFGENTILSAMVDATGILGETKPSIAVGGRTYVAKWLGLGGVFAYRNGDIDYLGLNSTLKLGPIQLHLISDNALTLLFPENANDLHFRAGLNLLFGKEDKKKKGTTPNSALPHL